MYLPFDAVCVATIVVFVRLNEEVRLHGIEAHDAIEAGLLDAQPPLPCFHVYSEKAAAHDASPAASSTAEAVGSSAADAAAAT
jgi:hypothetical protein